jgi:cyclohexa-1,5-dienecarbonyl-CoA hydratase
MAENMYSKLMVAMQTPVARVILANPPVNVIDMPMMEELMAAINEVERRDDIVAVVFGGSDRAFSAGVDIASHMPETIGEMLRKFHAVIRALMTMKKVTIAVVRGTCLGGGAELAAVCDLVFTSDSANWGFPEISLGCFPPVACAMLAEVAGQKHAAELMLTGRQMSGEDAMRMGLANEALPEDELSEIVDDTSDRLGQLSPAALRLTKKAMGQWSRALGELDRIERVYLEELTKTEDAVEGIRSFLEKRPAKWRGR